MIEQNTVQVYNPPDMPVSLYDRVIEKAISSDSPIEQLEKLLELKLRDEENEAKKAYNEAMAKFKADPPAIVKDRHVDFQTSKGRTEYNHASLANVTSTINSALSRHGLSASWRTDQQESLITVTCCITHNMGHQECTSLSAAKDDSGGKNAIQAIGSTVSYLERYTLLAITGLATHDQDDDGRGAEIEYITEDQAATIESLIKEVGANENLFLTHIKVESIEKIPANGYKNAVRLLEKKRKKNDPGE